MGFVEDIKESVLVFDGSMGTMLQKLGLSGGSCPEEWNLKYPERVKAIYKMYVEAGANVIQSNTFQANSMKLGEYGLEDKLYDINFQGVRLAKEAMQDNGYVAASIGPLGKLLEPYGELTFEKAYDTYKEQVIAVRDGGADIISFETFSDVCEMRIALIAAKENCNLPVICSMSYEQNGKTLMGTDPSICAITLNALGADLIGTNCSFGAKHMLKIAESYSKTGLCFSMKPNAGLPETIDGKQVYTETAEHFAQFTDDFINYGARLLGGCCGTNPDFIEAIARKVKAADVCQLPLDINYITSAVKSVAVDKLAEVDIGRIDINGDDSLLNSLKVGDIDAITDIAMDLVSDGCEVVVVDIDFDGMEDEVLAKVISEAQTYIKQPFIIKTSNAKSLENALRVYKGRAGVIVDMFKPCMAELIEKFGAVKVNG